MPLCLQNKWGHLLVKEFISIFGVQGSNLVTDMVMVNNYMLTKYSLYLGHLALGTYLGLRKYLD